MYYLSEKNNLKQMDEALARRGKRNSVFENTILTSNQIYNSAGVASRLNRSEKPKSEFWKNFTVPIHDKIQERSTQSSTPASYRRESERKSFVEAFHKKQDIEKKSTGPQLDYGQPKS